MWLFHVLFFKLSFFLIKKNYHLYQRASQVVLVVREPPANAGDIKDAGSFPGWGRSPGGGHGNQYSYLENHIVRGAWQARVPRVEVLDSIEPTYHVGT